MASTDKSKNGASTASLPEGWEEWPTMLQAANLLGITSARLSQYVKTGAVRKYAAPNSRGSAIGSYRFDPAELERLEEVLADEAERAAAPTTADTVRASVEGQKVAQGHVERLITLLEGPYKYLVDALRLENEALRADNAALRAERKSLEAMREDMRSQKVVEELALLEVKSAQETKQQAVEIAKPIVKHFINAALLKGGADPRLLALKEAVEAIPKATFAALFESGILSEEIASKIKFGLAWEETPAAPEPEAST